MKLVDVLLFPLEPLLPIFFQSGSSTFSVEAFAQESSDPMDTVTDGALLGRKMGRFIIVDRRVDHML